MLVLLFYDDDNMFSLPNGQLGLVAFRLKLASVL